jgi:hypothetical protein
MNREFGGHGMRGWRRWWRRPHDLQAARTNELTGQGNPPGLRTRGFLPRGKRREVGFNTQVGGFPKSAKNWPRGD